MANIEFNTGVIRPIECVREAWGLIKDEYWILLGVSIVGALTAGLTLYVLIGAMVCGIFGCYLKKIDGGRVAFEDLWRGLKFFWPSLLVTIAIVVPIVVFALIMVVTVYLPIMTAAITGHSPNDEELLTTLFGGLALDLVVAIIMTCIHSLLIFCFPLIVDKKFSSWESMKLTARAVMKNIGGISGMIAVSLGLALAGGAIFCVGMYLVIPLITAANLVAYRKVFPAMRSV